MMIFVAMALPTWLSTPDSCPSWQSHQQKFIVFEVVLVRIELVLVLVIELLLVLV